MKRILAQKIICLGSNKANALIVIIFVIKETKQLRSLQGKTSKRCGFGGTGRSERI